MLMADNALIQIKRRHLAGEIGGVCAICSSHPFVLKAAMEAARDSRQQFLVEATPNQVNLSGGYSGMTPTAFAALIKELAETCRLSQDAVAIGADHLGPHLWKTRTADEALQRCRQLVRACVRAGFKKIHLDTAVCCVDDHGPTLDPEVVAQRAALLCQAAEAEVADHPHAHQPVYVIGNEVPRPGGSQDECRAIRITDPGDVAAILGLYLDHFKKAGIEASWQRVVAVVVQPGVEFGDTSVTAYRPGPARALSAHHGRLPANMTYEVHSADYQPAGSLSHMVKDHFVIFKIGPCLTHDLHRTLFSLADLESEWPAVKEKSSLREVMETVMVGSPEHWQTHYLGSPEQQKAMREQSLRDRIRYYWQVPRAARAVNRLLENLNRPLPDSLTHRYFPDATAVSAGDGVMNARRIIHLSLLQTLQPYYDACQPTNRGQHDG